jgi:hypothetical protein
MVLRSDHALLGKSPMWAETPSAEMGLGPVHHAGHLDRGGHRLTVHPPGGITASTRQNCCDRHSRRILPLRPLLRLPPVPRAAQRSARGRRASSGEVWPRFCTSALLSSTAHCVGKYTLNRPHPDPSPVSGDGTWAIVARRKIGKLDASGRKAARHHPDHLDHGGHRLAMHPALEYTQKSW